MPTFGQLKTQVAAYMNRSMASFISGNLDLLTVAINGARKWAEMQHNFELARTSAKFPAVSFTDGALLSSAVDYYNPQNPISIKVIERAFVDDGKGGVLGIGVHSRNADILMKRKGSNVMSTVGSAGNPTFSLIRHGDRVYLSAGAASYFPDQSAIPVYCDVVRWMPDYTNVDQTDFFLTFCERFMLYKSVLDLHVYLKEDPRSSFLREMVEAEWVSVLRWDASLVDSTSEDAFLE